MLFVLSDRSALLDCVPRGGRAAELGVFTGDHAAGMQRVIGCNELHLVDTWSYDPADRVPFPDMPEHMMEREAVVADYFGPDPDASLEEHFRTTVQRFANDPAVTIHRSRTSDAYRQFDDGCFDMIYVDANHQYEYVLRDLLEWGPELRMGGLMFLNDHYDSPDGRRQNLGVIGATAAFVKRSAFDYVAMSAAPWSDMVLTNDPGSAYAREFVGNLLRQPAPLVELPDAVVPHYNHKFVAGPGFARQLPSFM